MVTHFTRDYEEVRKKLLGLAWPKGSTLTSLALMKAQAELSLGEKDNQGVVIVITDGRPLSYRKTRLAARQLRKSARLVWVPVTKLAPLKFIKTLATRRWQENVVQVQNFTELAMPYAVTHVIADICPEKEPELDWGPGMSTLD